MPPPQQKWMASCDHERTYDSHWQRATLRNLLQRSCCGGEPGSQWGIHCVVDWVHQTQRSHAGVLSRCQGCHLCASGVAEEVHSAGVRHLLQDGVRASPVYELLHAGTLHVQRDAAANSSKSDGTHRCLYRSMHTHQYCHLNRTRLNTCLCTLVLEVRALTMHILSAEYCLYLRCG